MLGKCVLPPSKYSCSSQAAICQPALLQQPVCEAEQRADGICWLCGALAGGMESLAADLMTGDRPYDRGRFQPLCIALLSSGKVAMQHCTAVYSPGVWGLERSLCSGAALLSDVQQQQSYLMSWAMCALHSVLEPLCPPDGPHLGAHDRAWGLLRLFKQFSRTAVVLSLFLWQEPVLD